MASDTPHGQKRHADDDLKNEQRLAKRFDLLNLEQNGKLYVPVAPPLRTPPLAAYTASSDSMFMDDTPNRVYIHNLDAELEDDEPEEEKVIFIPDIEKKLGKIPQVVLTDDVSSTVLGKQMVLYKDPESISVPKEHDSVRKAILESRARAREKQFQKAADGQPQGDRNGVGDGKILQSHEPLQNNLDDDDAMEIG